MQALRLLIFYGVVYGSLQRHPSHDHLEETNTAQVLIIGAGISGLEAARLLRQKGIKVLVLEARNRTGGRIWTRHSSSNHLMDMGASFIHGIQGSIPSGFLTNPIWDLTQEAKIRTQATREKTFLGLYPADDSMFDVQTWYTEYLAFAREETRTSSTNGSFAYYAYLFGKQKNFTDPQQYIFDNYLQFVIGTNEAAELATIAAKGFLDVTSSYYGKEHIFNETGYMALTDYLAKDLVDLYLEHLVTRISYNETLVEVLTQGGQIYQAKFVLITVPLGVLKRKQIEFDPPLPQWKLDTIDRIGFGNYEKVFLLWNQVWWNVTDFYFARIPFQSNQFRYWSSSDTRDEKAMITCSLVGEAGLKLTSKQNQEEFVVEIRSTLQKMFSDLVVPAPDFVYMTNWSQDPFSYGSYSYISVNQRYEDPRYLSEPIGNRLLFAGEATSTDAYGYTHGALISARREVTRLLFVYDLLPEQNSSASSRSALAVPLVVLIISNIISLHL